MDLVVNGTTIAEAAVHREMQYHPARSVEEARNEAARALVIRELLVQEAARLGVAAAAEADETEEEARIRCLIEREIKVAEPDEASCRRYYDNNRAQFRVPDVHTVSHILIAAPPDDVAARDKAERQARELLAELEKDPRRFPELAGRYSACPSRERGGAMGQVRRGDTVPEFERALAALQVGEIARRPVATRYGYHLILLEGRESGQALAFEQSRTLIADYLRESAFRRALTRYVQVLAERAQMSGINLLAEQTPACGEYR
jgi:peptidyl-prolyl cis-trans isomerase C